MAHQEYRLLDAMNSIGRNRLGGGGRALPLTRGDNAKRPGRPEGRTEERPQEDRRRGPRGARATAPPRDRVTGGNRPRQADRVAAWIRFASAT